MSDDYRVDLTLQGDPAMLPVAMRMFMEMGEVPDGPEEDEIERLAAAVEPMLAALLGSLSQLPGPPHLDLVLSCDAGRVSMELAVAAAAKQGRDLLGKDAGKLVAGMERVFDKVDGPHAPSGQAFALSLLRTIAA